WGPIGPALSPNAQRRWPSGRCPHWQPHKPERPTNSISGEGVLADIVVSARPFAELFAPPTMRHQSATPTAVMADLTLLGVWDSHDMLLTISHDVSVVAVSSARAASSEWPK